MTPMIHLLMLASAGAAGSLVSAVWEGLVLATCVGVCLRFWPGISAAARSVVWMAVLVVVAGLPLLHHSGQASVTQGDAHGFQVNIVWSIALVAVWALLTLVRAGQLVWSAVHLRGVALRATPVEVDASVLRLLEDGGRNAVLCSSEEIDRPSVVGFFTPRILLPPDVLEKLQPAELAQIVLHEMEHLRRGDDWTNLVQKLCLTLFPLNPVLFWIERRLCVERELACDDGVLRAQGERRGAAKAYASCLANLAEHRLMQYQVVRRGVSLALGAWERQSELAKRVHRILDRRETPMTGARMAMTLGCLLSGVAAGGFALAHSPRVVNFVAEAPPQMASAPITATQGFDHVSAHATMAKAMMPGRQSVALPVAAANHVRRVATKRRDMTNIRPSRPAAQTWYVLTTWQQVEVAPRVSASATYVVAGFPQEREPQFSYAIATRNGWLVFQL